MRVVVARIWVKTKRTMGINSCTQSRRRLHDFLQRRWQCRVDQVAETLLRSWALHHVEDKFEHGLEQGRPFKWNRRSFTLY